MSTGPAHNGQAPKPDAGWRCFERSLDGDFQASVVGATELHVLHFQPLDDRVLYL